METIAISAVVGVVLFAIGIFCGKASPCNHDLYGCGTICPHWDYEIKSGKISAMETAIFRLERENERLTKIYQDIERNCHYTSRVAFYAETPKQQEVADLLKNTVLNSKEIAKKLDIKL